MKTCLITGATSGIGKAAAQAIAAQGHRVVIVGRNSAKTEATAAELRRVTGHPHIDPLVADLSSLAEVRRLAAEVSARYPQLHVLVNNAGAFFMRRHTTMDGLEMTFALNHLSGFLLTNLLLERLKASAPARIVNVTSAMERDARPDWDDLQLERRYNAMQAYAISKRFNLYFTYELARRLEGSRVTVNAVHPGAVATGIWTRPAGRVGALLGPLLRRIMRSPEQGADTVVYLALAPEVEGVSGRYFVDRRPRTSSRASQDPEAARRAWAISAALTGLPVEGV
ncbi:MAG: SDR family oxidoreductase [Anaerolineae bacterium]|nr:SDR family oxidoreductase [Caldilineales bacterium]MCX7851987.1 SDR family oxidoreductase [Caldilineales bacterium]MDW8267651.1 SDR family oxidoreductase [Anaerolineae bacterium]